MKAGQSVILINLYLFCSRLARGDKRLKNNQYPDLFFFCFALSPQDVSRFPRRILLGIFRIALRVAGFRLAT
jgi:hypothetical protein